MDKYKYITIKLWVQRHSRAQDDWTTMKHHLQKPEDLAKFNERFFQCYLLHSGQTEYDVDTLDRSQELPKGVKARLFTWDTGASTLADIIEVGEKVEQDEEVRIRLLSHKEKEKDWNRE